MQVQANLSPFSKTRTGRLRHAQSPKLPQEQGAAQQCTFRTTVLATLRYPHLGRIQGAVLAGPVQTQRQRPSSTMFILLWNLAHILSSTLLSGVCGLGNTAHICSVETSLAGTALAKKATLTSTTTSGYSICGEDGGGGGTEPEGSRQEST